MAGTRWFRDRATVTLIVIACLTGAPPGVAATQQTGDGTRPAVPAAGSGSTTLPEPLARTARALGVPQQGISLWVQALDESAPSVAVNPEVLRNPASTLKLVTTFAALEGLGPDHAWETDVFLGRPLDAAGATGDLWIRGGGDPWLVPEEFWRLLGALRDRGLRRIEGDLVFDLSRFDLPPEDRGAFDGQPDRVYNVLPHPLLVNFNAARFRVAAGTDGRASVAVDPPLPNLRIDNRLQTGGGACGGYQNGVAIRVSDTARDRVALDGRFPSACREYELSRSVLQPESYAYGLFSLYWEQLGGELAGGWRIDGPGRAGTAARSVAAGSAAGSSAVGSMGAAGIIPVVDRSGGQGSAVDTGPGARAAAQSLDQRFGEPFHTHRSRPLADILRLVNKYSNNVMTRLLEYELAVVRRGVPATPESGRQSILDVLVERGIDTSGLVIANSAGLARETRISARQLAAVLTAAWNSPWMPEYLSSLALPGVDGTLRNRFRSAPFAGRMHLKTGRLDGVSAIAGYADTASGRRMLVVLLVNAPKAHLGPGEELQGALLDWVWRSF